MSWWACCCGDCGCTPPASGDLTLVATDVGGTHRGETFAFTDTHVVTPTVVGTPGDPGYRWSATLGGGGTVVAADGSFQVSYLCSVGYDADPQEYLIDLLIRYLGGGGSIEVSYTRRLLIQAGVVVTNREAISSNHVAEQVVGSLPLTCPQSVGGSRDIDYRSPFFPFTVSTSTIGGSLAVDVAGGDPTC